MQGSETPGLPRSLEHDLGLLLSSLTPPGRWSLPAETMKSLKVEGRGHKRRSENNGKLGPIEAAKEGVSCLYYSLQLPVLATSHKKVREKASECGASVAWF